MSPTRLAISVLCLAAALLSAAAQTPQSVTVPTSVNHRTRLILKDGNYQAVMNYRVTGSLVSYVSADRAGSREEIPVALIDWAATLLWDKQHGPDANMNAEADAAIQQQKEQAQSTQSKDQRPVLSPELAAEEADRAARRPEVAPALRLPEVGSIYALDYFHSVPELVPIPQDGSDLNPLNSHAVTRAALNPQSAPHPIVSLKGEVSLYQMHVETPVFYLRIGEDSGPPGGKPFIVDTHGVGQKDVQSGGALNSRYVILRLDPRVGARNINSFSIASLGYRRQADVIETTQTLLPGGHWMSVTPKAPLIFGEYALIEVIDDRSVNTAVWDFGVHPTMGDNRDSFKPEPQRPPSLGRHTPDLQ